MPELRELNYQEVVRRLRKLGFRFYRQGKGSHELFVGLWGPKPSRKRLLIAEC